MPFFTVLVGSKVALGALALGTIAVGGTAAAAYTGSLPGDLQDTAHSLIGAPTATPTPGAALPTETPTPEPTSTDIPTATPSPLASPTAIPTAGPVGPDATGPAAHGLCTAYTHGGLSSHSVAYASLAKAAGGAAGITGYCTTVLAPHASTTDVSTPAPSRSTADTPAASTGHEHAGAGDASHSSGNAAHTPGRK